MTLPWMREYVHRESGKNAANRFERLLGRPESWKDMVIQSLRMLNLRIFPNELVAQFKFLLKMGRL